MQIETLKIIDDVLTSLGIPYEYDEFTDSIESLDQFWVGEYQETEPTSEGGQEDATFILTGTAKNSLLLLEHSKNLIKQSFPTKEGRKAILDNGTGVAIFYANSFPVPTGDDFLKRLQINLTVKEWMVN